MRMHRKARLDERLAACADIMTSADMGEKNMKIAAGVPEYLPLREIFGNSRPVYLEIGCGKGKFVCESAALNPDINYVAVEKISNVLIVALERCKAEGLKNVYFLNCAAEVLEKYFPAGTVSRIYLNFSNPLPKKGYEKQRLTHPKFLAIYHKLLVDGGDVVQKTDDADLYEFSLASFPVSGFEIAETCTDLASSPVEGDVETEHERLFKSRGKKIFRIRAVRV